LAAGPCVRHPDLADLLRQFLVFVDQEGEVGLIALEDIHRILSERQHLDLGGFVDEQRSIEQ
jgi:hypothetical protein